MIKEIKYIANDGTEFDNEQQCMDYEEISCGVNIDLIVLDVNFKQLKTGEEISNYGKFVKARNKDDLKLYERLYNYNGLVVPTEIGYLRYNEDTDKYENIDDEIEKLVLMKSKLDECEKGE